MHAREPHPIVHRDLKPENILFTEKEFAFSEKEFAFSDFKIIDFGLARQYS